MPPAPGARRAPGGPAPATPEAEAPLWFEEQSLLGPRFLGTGLAIVVVAALVFSQMLTVLGAGKAAASVQDGFGDTSAAGLGVADSGQPWEVPTGGIWGEDGTAAYVVEPNANGAGRTMAVVDLRSSSGSVSATIDRIAPGWGLVFRYAGPSNYWMVTASPRFAAYNIIHVDNGKAIPVDHVELARQDQGTVVVVRFQGPTIELVLDDKTVKVVADPEGGTQGTKVGIVAGDGGRDGRWSAFEAQALPATSSVKAPTTKAGAGANRVATTTMAPKSPGTTPAGGG